MSGRLTADERVRRSLAMVPWVAAEDSPTVDEVCRRFGYTPDELQEELFQLFMCGLYPFTPDTLLEADIVDGRVIIRFPYAFSRPLRLTPAEALALMASTSVMLAEPGADRSGPLARGVEKLAALTGDDEREILAVELGPVAPEVLDPLRQAERDRQVVEFDYYSLGRDAHTRRRVSPYRVHNLAGHWYATGWCHTAEAVRRFRLDRMSAVSVLADEFELPDVLPDDEVYTPDPTDPVVTVTVPAESAWVVEQYPTTSHEVGSDGSVTVKLPVSEGPWLERLALRLGAQAAGDDTVVEARRTAAARVLARYRGAFGAR